MKIYTSVPRDLTRVKEKLIFNLTKRQLVCFGLAAFIGLPSYFLLKNMVDSTLATLCMVTIMIPMFLLAMYEKNGQHLEVILRNFIRTRFLRVKERPYKISNRYTDVGSKKSEGESETANLIMRIKARLTKNSPKTAQQSIPYQKMYPDGICKVKNHYYSKTIWFEDRNYQLLKKEDKEMVLEDWANLLKLFGSSVQFELSYMSLPEDMEKVDRKLRIPFRPDGLDQLREENFRMLKTHFIEGTKCLERIRLLTFGIEADSLKIAKIKLSHIEKEVLENLRKSGVEAGTLDGTERLQIMYRMLHFNDQGKFFFDWKTLNQSGMSTKDFISPNSFTFGEGNTFKIGNSYAAVSCLSITASEFDDEVLKDILDSDSVQNVTMHVQTVEKTAAIRMVKKTITELDRSKIDEQKKAVRFGYDMDILPSDLATFARDAKKLLEALQSEDEIMLLVTFLILNTGRTKEQLEENISRISRVVRQKDCDLWRLEYQQEQGIMSCLPLAQNQIEIQRGLTTSSTAILIPFMEQKIFHEGGAAIYYGVDQLTKELIIADRKRLKAPNALIFGSSGSGKSYKAKEEMTSVLLVTNDDVIICDPEAEYRPLVEKLGGQVIRICASSKDYINPLDINMNYSEEDDPLALKAEFILSMFELILEGSEGLQPEERTVIDRCLPKIYEKYFREPIPENMPILEDLYNELLKQDGKEAYRVSTALEMYVKGSLKVFNHRTNVDLKNRMVCFDIKDLGNQLKKLGMLIVQDHVWGRVTINRGVGRSTWYYADEFHLLLKEPQTATYAVETWKRFRKHGGICTGITQDVKDFLKSYEIENIIENSDFILMFNQGAGDRNILADRLDISPEQLKYVTGAGEGKGLMFYGDVILPFEDNYPKDTEMYRIMTTKLNEITPIENMVM